MKESGDDPVHHKACYGHKAFTSDITPSYGNTTKWTQNLSSGGMSGDISEGWSISTNVGKTYYQIAQIGTESGFYPPGRMVTGHSFQVVQNSTASRAVWMWRHGAMASDGKYWSSGAYSKINDYNWHSRSGDYGSSFVDHMIDNNLYIKYIVIQFSTSGGSSSRSTKCSIRNFKFKWIDVPSGKTLILPKLRPHADRTDINVIA